MFGQTFSHDIFRKHVIVFGNLFNDLRIERPAKGATAKQIISVPIEYGPRRRTLERIQVDPDLQRQAVILPRMSFEITSLQRDTQRQLNRIQKRVNRSPQSDDALISHFEPVAYVMGIQLSIYAKFSHDIFAIIEQILPYFIPEWNVSVRMVPNMDKIDNIKITLDSIQAADDYEGMIAERRMLVWTINFSMHTRFYGPTSHSGLIKKVMVNFYASNTDNFVTSQHASRYTVTPGLTANGTPTSDYTITIPYTEIGPNDDYGFVEQWEDFLTGETIHV